MDEDTIYYFAYGSNLNVQRMSNRRAEYSKREAAKLSNHQFKLNFKIPGDGGVGAANVEEKYGHDVYGALYTGTEKTLEALDKFEQVDSSQYARKNVIVELHDGSFVDAVTYVALITDDSIEKVEREYFEHILHGEDILPRSYYNWLKETFEGWCVS